MKAKRLAVCAVMTALLIAVQYALSFVSGVELVTVFFLCFSYVFGVRDGILVGISFSLLRCLIFGFFPNVVVLYLVYYSMFAAVFGILGKKKSLFKICPAALVFLLAASGYFAVNGLPISALYQNRIRVMLWILFGISAVILIFYIILIFANRSGGGLELASVTSAAAFMTVLFTLLDDIITPVFMGYSPEAAAGYFYAGFTAMLPQTICAAVSVFLLFRPLKKVFETSERTLHSQPNV